MTVMVVVFASVPRMKIQQSSFAITVVGIVLGGGDGGDSGGGVSVLVCVWSLCWRWHAATTAEVKAG